MVYDWAEKWDVKWVDWKDAQLAVVEVVKKVALLVHELAARLAALMEKVKAEM